MLGSIVINIELMNNQFGRFSAKQLVLQSGGIAALEADRFNIMTVIPGMWILIINIKLIL